MAANDEETGDEFLRASAEGRLTDVTSFVEVRKVDVNWVDKGGWTAVLRASQNGHLNVLQYLLGCGAMKEKARYGKNLPPTAILNSAIHFAAWGGHLDVLRYLIEQGIDKNTKNNKGWYPIMQAACQGHLNIVSFLVEQGADKDSITENGWYPITVAASRGFLSIVQYLTQHGADKDVTGPDGWTSLMAAASRGHEDVVIHLLDCGASLEASDLEGQTALHVTARNGHIHLLKQLSHHQAGMQHRQIKDKNGQRYMELLPVEKILSFLLMELSELDVDGMLVKVQEYDRCMWFMILQERPVEGSDHTISHILSFYSLSDQHPLSTYNLNVPYQTTPCNHLINPGASSTSSKRENEIPFDLSSYTKLTNIVKSLVSKFPFLADVKDANGHLAMEIASTPMKAAIQSVLLWHGRYRILDPRPEYMSTTYLLFKGSDEQTIDDETGHPMKVALKLMQWKSHFQREISTRAKDLHHNFIVNALQTFPEISSSMLDSWPDEVMDVVIDATGQLTKTNAEKFFVLVMPLADRNLFVALKQERWAGKNMEEVRHVFVQLVHCVEHLHEKGILHANLTTLNIVRTAGQWKLIDLDASCEIGKESVGHKYSSAYVPPEAIYIDEKTDTACVRSVTKGEVTYELLTAHPSYDVWSLGCILYQMVNNDVKPLFQSGQDDNLVGMRKGIDNLFSLAEWSPELKAEKLADVSDKLARNLLSQMLNKDPWQRPTLAQVLGHPFLCETGTTMADSSTELDNPTQELPISSSTLPSKVSSRSPRFDGNSGGAAGGVSSTGTHVQKALLDAKDEEIRTLTAELGTLKIANKEMKNDMQVRKNENTKLRQENQAFKNTIDHYRDENNVLKGELHRLRDDVMSLKGQRESVLASLSGVAEMLSVPVMGNSVIDASSRTSFGSSFHSSTQFSNYSPHNSQQYSPHNSQHSSIHVHSIRKEKEYDDRKEPDNGQPQQQQQEYETMESMLPSILEKPKTDAATKKRNYNQLMKKIHFGSSP